MILPQGTTRHRAEMIVKVGPNPAYQEPGGCHWPDGFSMYVEGLPDRDLETPEKYALLKAANFPSEGDPVILAIDVPDEIVRLAETPWLPLSRGLVQFDYGAGIEELLKVWDTLWKEIRPLPGG